LNHMVLYSHRHLDAVFGALADPTRRAILAALRNGERSVGELAEPFDMSLPGFTKHLGILTDAGLIAREKSGRVVNCRLNAAAMKQALEWLERYEVFWNVRLDRLGAYLEEQESESWKSSRTKRPASKSGASSRRPSARSTRRGRIPSK